MIGRRVLGGALLAIAGSAAAAGAPAPGRASLIVEGEAALARLDTQSAEHAFDLAAGMAHEADAELGLVRTYMQAGEYRRALSFVAHTSGAHLDEPAGAALQVWLLYLGGQRGPAETYLAQARLRQPADPVLREVRREIDSVQPHATAALLLAPARFAPYGERTPHGAITGSAWLFDEGRRALAPVQALQGARRVFLRNGLGATRSAVVQKRDLQLGIAELRLEQPLALPPEAIAPADPFAGSVAYSVEYVRSASAEPSWPLMRAGFMGQQRRLDFDAKRPGSGPVFDNAGRFSGLAANGRLLPISRIRPWLGDITPADSHWPSVMPSDEIYERALLTVLQVIRPAAR